MDLEKSIETHLGRYFIRPYEPKDAAQAQRLWELVFHKRMPDEVWRWKYHSTAFPRAFVLSEHENGALAGLYPGIVMPLWAQGRETLAANLMDSLSSPDHRRVSLGRRPLFALTADHHFELYGGCEKAPFFFGFSGERVVKLGRLLLKYYVIRPSAFWEKQLPAFWLPVLKPRGFTIVPILAGCSALDDLWQKAKAHHPMIVVRDRRFLEWRFFQHPKGSYEVWGLQGATGQLTAYAVTLVEGRTAIIVDFFGLPLSEKIGRFFLRGIERKLSSRGMKTMKTWLPEGHEWNRLFKAAGFEKRPEPLGIIPVVKSFCPSIPLEWAAENFCYTMADADLF